MNTVYPDFTKGDYSLKSIEDWCVRYSVTFIYEYVETSDYPEGTIFAQSLAPGTRVQSGQRLTIRIAEAENINGTGTGEEGVEE